MRLRDKSVDLTPKHFEKAVRNFLHMTAESLESFKTTHRERLKADDGTYEIDVVARFVALGVRFVVLIECKKQKRPVEREVVQVLHDRVRAVGAHKGMLFSTGGFQRGAIAYVQRHGIALIAVAPGDMLYQVRDLRSSANILAMCAGPLSYWHCYIEDDKQTYAAILVPEDARRVLHIDSPKG